MFYFISSICKISSPIKVSEEFIIRNPNKDELEFFIRNSSSIKEKYEPIVDSEVEKRLEELFKKIIVFEIKEEKIYSPKDFKEHNEEFNKYKSIINFYMFVVSGLDMSHNEITLTYGRKGIKYISTNGISFFEKLVYSEILNEGSVELMHKIKEETITDIFSIHDLQIKTLNRIIYLGEIISLINETADYKLKFTLLIGILEQLLVNGNDGIAKQIKVKMIAVLVQAGAYNITYSSPMNNDFFQSFKHYYTIRSMIAHGNFNELNGKIKQLFGKKHFIQSITYGLEQNIAKTLYVFLISDDLIKALKES